MKKDLTQLRLKDINIRKPCSENWQTMDPQTGGRFCQNCQKQVIDFSNKTDEDLRSIIAEQGVNLCGRFRKEQIGHPAQVVERRGGMSGFFKKAAATAATLAIMQTAVQAADPPEKPRVELSRAEHPDKAESSPNTVVTGVVLTTFGENIPDDIKVRLTYQTKEGRKTLERTTHAGLFHFDLGGKAISGSPIVLTVPAQTIKEGHSEHKYTATRHAATLTEGQNLSVSVEVSGLWDDMIMGDIMIGDE